MKKIEVTEEFYNAAQRLAEYVDNEDSEYDAFKQWMDDGNDPKDSIYYCAAIVGGWLDQLELKETPKKKSKFQVFDCGKPADCFNTNVHKSWNNSLFDCFEEAEKYALDWLDIYGCEKGVLKLNEPYEYQEECFIEIRRV